MQASNLSPFELWTVIFCGVLFANMATAGSVIGFREYAKKEQDGTDGDLNGWAWFGLAIMPFVFGGVAFFLINAWSG